MDKPRSSALLTQLQLLDNTWKEAQELIVEIGKQVLPLDKKQRFEQLKFELIDTEKRYGRSPILRT